MQNPLALVAVLIVAAGGAAFYAWYTNTHAPEPVPVPPVAAAPPTVAPPVQPVAPPAIQHPIPAVPAAPLPPLADSDALAQTTLAELVGRDAFVRYFVPDALVRNFVVTVDNLPRKTASARLRPIRPVPGPFTTVDTGSELTIAPDNALRYRAYLVAMEGVEAKRLVAAYVRLYPLFQTAYQELGYPDGYFNDRLVQAIDDLLATPDIAAPKLVQPKVLYEFADPALEARSAGQKIMLRMGASNAARVKDKLRAIRKEIVAQAPQS